MNRAATDPLHHTLHCFDELRQVSESVTASGPTIQGGILTRSLQAIQCHADNLPLYTIGNGASGVQQAHQCRDWDSLRTFAAANSACYVDVADASTNFSHFGLCTDTSNDGLPSIAQLDAGDVGPDPV